MNDQHTAIRQYSTLDHLVMNLQNAVATLLPTQRVSTRPYPATKQSDEAQTQTMLTDIDRHHVAGLMRVNHAGEICAQALYQGQSLTANLDHVRDTMKKAAEEEVDHLAWCEQRLAELKSQPSLLNPVWYINSFFIGAIVGLIGDRWSLGFVAETEKQVVEHLSKHIEQLPLEDQSSRKILQQMREDEASHATTALNAGGEELPEMIKQLMNITSKIMTNTAYYI